MRDVADRELLDQYLAEARDLVQAAAACLLAIERSGADASLVTDAFRAVHTLKGGAAICGLAPIEHALHAAEDLLDALRAERLDAAGAASPLLDAIARTEAWLASLEATGVLPPGAESEATRLAARLRATPGAAIPHAAPPLTRHFDPAPLAARHAHIVAQGGPLTALRYTPDRDCFFRGEDPLARIRALPGLAALDLELDARAAAATPFDPFRCHLAIEALSTASVAVLRDAFGPAADQVAFARIEPAPDPRTHAAARTLRVEVGRIDRLVDLAGELLAARHALAGRADAVALLDPALGRDLRADFAAIGRLAGQLHRAASEFRLTPLAACFRRAPLAVRDTASALGKDVRLVTEGEEVEADRTLVEALFEPLLHLLRNAIDHGIEDAATRRAAAKPIQGRITLRAEAGPLGLAVTIADDGRGIDADALRRKAATLGIPDAASLTDAQAIELVFAPGFSTAQAVTGVSGRGVGMDAARAAIAALGGRISIASARGRGTTIRIDLPQSASLTPALLVRAAGERFAVPLVQVAEAARIEPGRIVALGAAEAFTARGRSLALRPLATLVGLPAPPTPAARAHRTVLLPARGDVAVEVDALEGREDLLLRPAHGLLAGLPGLLGTAIEADGSPLLVLDLASLALA